MLPGGRVALSAIPSIAASDPAGELCGAPWTALRQSYRTRAVYREHRQVPVTINREINGFVLNPAAGRVAAEAFRLVAKVISPAEDLDHTVKDGLGLRWSFLGPFETIELNAPGASRIIARATPVSTRSSPRLPPGPSLPEPECGPVIAAWPQQPTPNALPR